jgi:hypothetical protein
MFAWSQLDFSAIPVSSQQANLAKCKQKIAKKSNCKGRGMTSEKRYILLLFFCFWGEVSNS